MSNARIGPLGTAAAVAWIAVPILWGLTRVLDRTRDWDGAPKSVWMIGSGVLVAAGVITLLLVMRHTADSRRRRLLVAGYVVYGLGIAATVIVAWAIQLWMMLFGAGLLLLALAAPAIRRQAVVISAGMLTGLAVQIILTMAEVGRPDSFGDYPVAWTTATIVATVVAAAGCLALDQRAPAPEPVMAPVA